MARRVLVLFPEGDTAAVEAFRREWDPLAESVPAHITLAYPFDDERPAEELAASLQTIAASVQPFSVALQQVVVEDDEYLFLVPTEGARQIRQLHDALYEGPLALVPKPDRFVPHMTVARSPDPGRVRDAERAVRTASVSFTGVAATLSAYRVEARERGREFDVPLG